MRSMPILVNLNTGYGEAAAPDKGAVAFFFSTEFCALHHIMPLFEENLFDGNASKKA